MRGEEEAEIVGEKRGLRLNHVNKSHRLRLECAISGPSVCRRRPIACGGSAGGGTVLVAALVAGSYADRTPSQQPPSTAAGRRKTAERYRPVGMNAFLQPKALNTTQAPTQAPTQLTDRRPSRKSRPNSSVVCLLGGLLQTC